MSVCQSLSRDRQAESVVTGVDGWTAGQTEKETERGTFAQTGVHVSSEATVTVTWVWSNRVDAATTETQAGNHITLIHVYTHTHTHTQQQQMLCWEGYFLKVVCYTYKWPVDESNLLQLLLHVISNKLLSVLWRCWMGGRKGIRPVKKLSGGMLAWLSVWGEVQIIPFNFFSGVGSGRGLAPSPDYVIFVLNQFKHIIINKDVVKCLRLLE